MAIASLVKLDGQQVLDYTDPKPLRRGHIGLQFNSGQVAFRNIRLKPLGMTSLFNGRDLTGWKTYPQMPSKFTVTDAGELNVQNGRGQLESEGRYGDFALQLECQTHAPRLNSGVFFRCIPGEEMMGYECQIHNGFQNDDRDQPQDCGTGGFFRRQNARRVVADDLKWFHMTLIADGAHMAAWVNGYQVSDWTDDRPAKRKPSQRIASGAGDDHDSRARSDDEHLVSQPADCGVGAAESVERNSFRSERNEFRLLVAAVGRD